MLMAWQIQKGHSGKKKDKEKERKAQIKKYVYFI